MVMGVQAFVSFCGYQAVSTICRRIYCSSPVTKLAADNYDARRIYVLHAMKACEVIYIAAGSRATKAIIAIVSTIFKRTQLPLTLGSPCANETLIQNPSLARMPAAGCFHCWRRTEPQDQC